MAEQGKDTSKDLGNWEYQPASFGLYELYCADKQLWVKENNGVWEAGHIDGDNGFVALTDKTFPSPIEAIKELTQLLIMDLAGEITGLVNSLPKSKGE